MSFASSKLNGKFLMLNPGKAFDKEDKISNVNSCFQASHPILQVPILRFL